MTSAPCHENSSGDARVEEGDWLRKAEIDLENVIRDIDGDLAKLDRQDPTLNAQASVFPDGYGKEIDPEGESQLRTLDALRDRLAKFGGNLSVGMMLAKFDAARFS